MRSEGVQRVGPGYTVKDLKETPDTYVLDQLHTIGMEAAAKITLEKYLFGAGRGGFPSNVHVSKGKKERQEAGRVGYREKKFVYLDFNKGPTEMLGGLAKLTKFTLPFHIKAMLRPFIERNKIDPD